MGRATIAGALLLTCLAFQNAWADDPPRVVASTKPIHSLVSAIMLGVGEPLLLMDGSVPPWEYELGAVEQAALEKSDLVVWTGPELETRIGHALAHLDSKPRIIEVLSSERLKILASRGGEGKRDAYFWLDSRNMLILLDELAEVLAGMDPERAQTYERNRNRAFEAIAEVDRTLEYGYRGVSALAVFFYHDTHQYFEQAFAMKLAGTVAGPPGTSSEDAAGLVRLRRWLTDAPAHCLFVEAGVPQPHLDLLLAGTDVTPIELDSLGSEIPAGPDLYVRLMRQAFETIAGCVRAAVDKGEAAPVPGVPDVAKFPERVTPRYLLTDQHGRTISDRDFAGQYQLISFGYTACPDVCPTTLATTSRTMELLGQEAAQVQPIFITVDPKRDTPEVLGKYLAYFHPRLLGLSGSLSATKRTAELFKARFEIIPAEDGDPDRYSMDHTASHYLLGRGGEFITKFAYGLAPGELAKRIRGYMGHEKP